MSKEKVLQLIAKDLMKGKRLMIEDANKYGSSQSAFSRRIKDLKQFKKMPIKTDKVLIGKSKFSVYYIEKPLCKQVKRTADYGC